VALACTCNRINFARKIEVPTDDEEDDVNDIEDDVNDKDVHLVVYGLAEDVICAWNKIHQIFKTRIIKESVQIQPLSFARVQSMCSKFNIKLELVTGKVETVDLEGEKVRVYRAKMAILEKVAQEVQKASKPIFPSEWEPQKENFVLIPLSSSSPEYQTVINSMTATLKKTIIRIDRVQNKFLYEQYLQYKSKLIKKGSNINEQFLFHGSSSNPPVNIFNGLEGWDMRFSNPGMWGQGIYFAVNANYSALYAFNSPQGKQVFYASVLLGDSVKLPADNKLKMPPEKKTSVGQFAIDRYDSVEGFTGNSVIFILYSNGVAYPSYLITYQE